jgi:hypothetical protein
MTALSQLVDKLDTSLLRTHLVDKLCDILPVYLTAIGKYVRHGYFSYMHAISIK